MEDEMIETWDSKRREIKFRAWDQTHNEMIKDDSKFFIDFDGRVFQQMYVEEAPHPVDGVILMQFTGLKDKDGVEIYEGDILQDTDLDVNEVMKVPGGLILANNNWDYFTNFSDTMKVIGNVFENKEPKKNGGDKRTDIFKLTLIDENTGKETQARITKQYIEHLTTKEDMTEQLGGVLLRLFRELEKTNL